MAGPWMRPGYLAPVLDFEDGNGVRTDGELTQFALDFGNRIYAAMGIRPAIYINSAYAQNVLAGGTTTQRNQLAQQPSLPPGLATSPTFPTLWSARWPAGPSEPYLGDVQNENPKDTYGNVYGPWDDYGVEHPWSFWQYSSGGRLQSFNNGGQDLNFNIANGGIEFLKDKLVPAVWMNNTSGDWATLANWNSGQPPTEPTVATGQLARVGPLTLPTPRLPGAAGDGVTSGQHDTVILERASANITVTHSTGATNIRKLYVREALNITGGSLAINYVPSPDSTPISAQFSAAVSLSGEANLSVPTLQVDASRTFTVDGGNLAFSAINLQPGTVPGRMLLTDDMNVTPLGDATATIANGAGSGTSGRFELGGANRKLNVADGAAAVDLSINVPVNNGGLTKAGAGTLALSGENTYAGDTIVEAGTLRLAGAKLANTADVYLSTGATLDLTFPADAPDVIDSLLIDGVPQAAGVWGAVGSGAPFTSPLITGTGRLQVTTFSDPLAGDFDGDGTVDADDLTAWQDGFGMQSGALAEHGDGDGDGDVDGGDFLAWQRNLGQTPGSGAVVHATVIPEPLSTALALLALGGLMQGKKFVDR
jgi:autotransporter-associated beta strand protein